MQHLLRYIDVWISCRCAPQHPVILCRLRKDLSNGLSLLAYYQAVAQRVIARMPADLLLVVSCQQRGDSSKILLPLTLNKIFKGSIFLSHVILDVD